MQLRLVCFVSAVLLLASSAAAEMYRYVDAHGQTHFTDEYYEVPERYRDQVEAPGSEYQSPGNYSVVPGFGEKPGLRAEKDKKDAKGRKAQQAGLAGRLQEGVAEHFNQMTGKPLSSMSGGMVAFMILLVVLIALAIGGGILITGCNVGGERAMPLGHAMLIVLVQSLGSGLASFALNLTLSIVGQPSPALAMAGAGLQFVTGLGIQAAVLKGMHCDTWVGAFKVTLIVLLLSALLLVPVVYCAVH
jgi:hypothetical protein